jgi:hypothetical protein
MRTSAVSDTVALLLLLLLLQCFQIPFVRHLYWWIGIRPITRHWIRRLLHKGLNVVLVPGGVQVCVSGAYRRKRLPHAFGSKCQHCVRGAGLGLCMLRTSLFGLAPAAVHPEQSGKHLCKSVRLGLLFVTGWQQVLMQAA